MYIKASILKVGCSIFREPSVVSQYVHILNEWPQTPPWSLDKHMKSQNTYCDELGNCNRKSFQVSLGLL